MSVQENIAAKNEAYALLKSHCLFLKQEGDIVFLPEGYYPQGIRIEETSKGYNVAREYLEGAWKQSLSWSDTCA